MTSPNIRDAKYVLIIGATAGIGRELALAIHNLPNKPTVVVTGRREERLDELNGKSPRIEGMQLDVTEGRAALKDFVDKVVAKYPEVSLCITVALFGMLTRVLLLTPCSSTPSSSHLVSSTS